MWYNSFLKMILVVLTVLYVDHHNLSFVHRDVGIVGGLTVLLMALMALRRSAMVLVLQFSNAETVALEMIV